MRESFTAKGHHFLLQNTHTVGSVCLLSAVSVSGCVCVLFKSCGEKGTRAKNGHIGLCSALCTLGYSYTLIRQEQEIICTDLYFLHEAVPDLRDLPLDLGLDSCVVSSYSLVIYPLYKKSAWQPTPLPCQQIATALNV
jgi:hypothetical protein